MYLFFQEPQGDRSLFVNWFYHTSDSKWANPYRAGYGGRSVYDALNDLVKYQNTSNDVSFDVKGHLDRCATTNCTKLELLQIQHKLISYYGATASHQRFNDAVTIMHNDDVYPGASGVVFGWNSFAFVFPRYEDAFAIYAIAHELGHTLGFNHINGGCLNSQGWDCVDGALMSYNSTNPYMDFSYQSKEWFKKAPWHWVHPRFGLTPNFANGQDGANEYNSTQIINW